MNIEEAKQVLKDAGFFVDNLWHINDVKHRYNCDDDKLCQSILYNALTNDNTIERIWDSIDYEAQEEKLDLIDQINYNTIK